jgi:uncharacterized protein (TIGR01777 family)
MKIFITGGTGFVGSNLTREFSKRGHQVTVLDRSIKARETFPPTVSFIETDSTVRGAWQEQAAEHEIFINLAGFSIFSRWNDQNKRTIRESRILTTNNLVEAASWNKKQRIRLFSTSAVGYYGFHGDEDLTEEASPGSDFLAGIARDWEASANQAKEFGGQVVICRFGIIMGRRGGALQQMLPIFRYWLGSPLGNGRQWFSWIHEQDLVDIFVFLFDQKDVEGPVNCTAPQAVRNMELTRAIGETLGVPTFLPPVPAFMMKLALGEVSDIVLKGQKVIPKKLMALGYRFRFRTIQDTLNDLLKKGIG